ncbi:S1 RNA-binding domain-containing protein, partial [Myxococcota bacterium]|nr:S1 RNA-binding domain-containing protein [Myxococcota bacterium]
MSEQGRVESPREIESIYQEDAQVADLYDYFEAQSIRAGEIRAGFVKGIEGEDILIDLGLDRPGRLPKEDAIGQRFAEGEEFEFYLEEIRTDAILLSFSKSKRLRLWERIEGLYKKNEQVNVRGLARVRGGVSVSLFGVKATLPDKELGPLYGEDLLERVFPVLITHFDEKKAQVTVSHAALFIDTRTKEEVLAGLVEGEIVEGMVKNLTHYGAFVDLGGGVDGLLHIGDMSHSHIATPEAVVKVGQRLKLKILKLNVEKGRISLGLKQLSPDPWQDIQARYPSGAQVKGRVRGLADYGAFVELEVGVEGLIHVSELAWTRIKHPKDVLSEDQEIEVQVLSVDPKKRRVSLSLKRAQSSPWEAIRARYPLGTRLIGPVRSISTFGLFIAIEEGLDGLVHVADVSWRPNNRPLRELYKKGDEVEAMVLGVDVDNQRITLGIKQLVSDDTARLFDRFKVDERYTGEVVRLIKFGAFVRLAEGVEGLLHISEMAEVTPEEPGALLKVGQEVEVFILSVDAEAGRISLSMRLDEAEAVTEEMVVREVAVPESIPAPGEEMVIGASVVHAEAETPTVDEVAAEPAPEPVAEPEAPVEAAPEPVAEVIEEVIEPVAEVETPVEAAPEPVAEVIEPVEEVIEPVAEVEAPVEAAPEPVAEVIEEVIEPVAEVEAPVEAAPEPVAEVIEPAEEVIEPVAEPEAPVEAAPEP